MNIPLVDLKWQYNECKQEIDSVMKDIIDNSRFIMGPELKEFEDNFSKFCNIKHSIATSNGTTALHLALLGCEVEDGEVITVPNTFISTTETITQAGCKIRFVDVDEQTLNINVKEVRKAINENTKAIIAVHLYGQMADMKELKKIADEYDLKLIEDAAQAHGAKHFGKGAGHYADATIFSFFPAKNLGGFGDGGMVVTNNDKIADKIRMLRNHGRIDKYEHLLEGYNYRLDNLQAGILNVKLKQLEKWNSMRKKIANFYNENLKGVQIPVCKEYNNHVYYMYVIRTNKRDELMNFLKEKGINCGIHYPINLHLQKAYSHLNLKECSFPVSEKASKEILSIPIYPGMNEEQQDYIVRNVNSFFE